jgi:Protein of unknown function (DUF2778)
VPGRRLHAARALDGGVWGRARLPEVSVGLAALVFGFALGLGADPPAVSAVRAANSTSVDVGEAPGSEIPPTSGMRLASLEPRIVSLPPIGDEGAATASAPSTNRRSSFDERFFFGAPPLASFDERFLGLAADRLYAEAVEEDADTVDPPLAAAEPAKPHRAGNQASAPAGAPKKRVRTAEVPADSSSGPELDDHTAIYDISARTVYLPNGRRLEAHSGLGEYMDDVRYVSTRMRGPTPPNVYALSLRESLFHGVRALRLTPVGNGNMYGRAGILAHTYMLGPNGQSNGCVSFNDYQAFLNAYLRGEIDRIVVVEHLDNVPDSKTASDWIPDAIKSFFKRS